MKGIARILEAILASVIILGSLSYFLVAKVHESRWGYVILENELQDVLVTLTKTGELVNYIRTNDITGLHEELNALLPKTVMYKLEVIGLPKPMIRIGCNCTESELSKLRKMLHIQRERTFEFNGRNLSLGFQRIALSKPSEDLDLIVFFGYRNLSRYSWELENFLQKDKGVLMIANLTDEDLNDAYLTELFGLNYKTGHPSRNNNFVDITNVSTLAYHISRLFGDMPIRIDTNLNTQGYFYLRTSLHNLTTGQDENGSYVLHDLDPTKYREGDVFLATDEDDRTWRIKVYKIDADPSDEVTYADIGIIDRNYTFFIQDPIGENHVAANELTIVKTTNDFASVQINDDVGLYGRGRAVWIKSYDPNATDLNQLLRSLVLYAAGERFAMEHYPTKLPERYVSVSLILSDVYFDFPFVVKLIGWFVY